MARCICCDDDFPEVDEITEFCDQCAEMAEESLVTRMPSPPNSRILPMTNQPTPEDREAAARIYQRFRDHDYAKWIREGINAGGDYDGVIQDFMNHRLTSTAKQTARIAELEAALDQAIDWIDKDDASRMGPVENAAHTRIIRRLEAVLSRNALEKKS